MNKQLSEVLPYLRLHGRTTIDEDTQSLMFNWTCSGFSVHFKGSVLKAKLCALGEAPLGPILGVISDGPKEMPWLAVISDGGETILKRIECKEPEDNYTLWEAPQEEEHTLRIVKLSENARGKAGLKELQTDGTLLPVNTPEKKLKIEFIGDSITCGYGNEASDKDAPFVPEEENGWNTYAAIAARALDAEFSCISVSGISVSRSSTGFSPFGSMEEFYPYTDAIYAQKQKKQPELWDFSKQKKDIVVLNLGTNDVNPIRFASDYDTAMKEESYFCEKYKKFLKMLRQYNGEQAWICCSLGPMDYYLYNDIQKAVEEYQHETGDMCVHCFKYVGINLLTEGFGAVGHPSEKTHIRMADELVKQISSLKLI